MEEFRADLLPIHLRLQRILKIDSSIEVGAFMANYSDASINLPNMKHALAFEANPHVFQFFRDEIDKRIDYVNLAVSDVTETKIFSVQVFDESTSTSLSPIRGNNSLKIRSETNKNYESVSIEAIDLDTFLKQDKYSQSCNKISLWIDAEGAAYEVLVGARETLKKTTILNIELELMAYWRNQTLANEVVQFLARFGFVPLVRDFEATQQFNLIFVQRMHLTLFMRTRMFIWSLQFRNHPIKFYFPALFSLSPLNSERLLKFLMEKANR